MLEKFSFVVRFEMQVVWTTLEFRMHSLIKFEKSSIISLKVCCVNQLQ